MLFARRALVTMLLALPFTAACGGGKGTAADPVAAAATRLQGNWRLLAFAPALSLEEPLQGLLSAELNTLRISFSGGDFTATGQSVRTSGRFQVQNADGDQLSGMIFDRAGAAYHMSGQFIGDQFRFRCDDPPWSGSGVLVRDH